MKKQWVALFAVFALALSLAAQANTKLKEGDSAPPLKVAKWVKGTPITSFTKGNLYVVEFWATWCGPCKESIPHLTKLAKKYADKVTFIGVDVWEEDGKSSKSELAARVTDFVTAMGDQMSYNVATDTDSGFNSGIMNKTWMKASGQKGIPSAFVVDREGKIAWIGYATDDHIDELIELVATDKFDSVAKARFAKAKADEEELQKKSDAMNDKIMALAKKGKTQEAFTALDLAGKTYPDAFPARYIKYICMNIYFLAKDGVNASATAKALAENEAKDDPVYLSDLAMRLVYDNYKLKSPDYDVALTIAERAVVLTERKDAGALATLAYVQYKKGASEQAITTEQEALALPKTPKATRDVMNKHLKLFQSKKRKG